MRRTPATADPLDAHRRFLRDLRIDSGVREGSEISIHYDPLVAKFITTGRSRSEALANMRTALDLYVIRGA